MTTTKNGGVGLRSSSNNTLYENNITNNTQGVHLYSSNNTFCGNNIITNTVGGVSLSLSSNNTFSGNNITNTYYGVRLYYASDNRFYHNNFIDNTAQVEIIPSGYANFWDDGYPSGGNYWSDYSTRYPDAQELDGSGIWDTPYVIDDFNQDNYPLMGPWTPPEVPPVEDIKAYIKYVNETIQDLPDELFTRPEEDVPNVKNDFSELFDDALQNVDEGNYEGVIEKLDEIKDKIYVEIVESAEREEIISLIDNLIALRLRCVSTHKYSLPLNF